MSAGSDVQPGKARRWLLPALVVSLVLNMLLVGLIAGARLHHGGWRGHGERHFGFLKDLPEGRRAELAKEMETLRGELHEKREAVHELRRRARALIAKEPFDAAAVSAAIEQISAARGEANRHAAQRFVEVLSRMSPEERRRFVEWRERRGKHRGGRDRDDF